MGFNLVFKGLSNLKLEVMKIWWPFWRTSTLGDYSSAAEVSGLLEYQHLD